MGCVFDLFSTSLNTRSYVAVMFVIAWFIPLITITSCYVGIVLRVWYCPNRKFLSQRKSSGCPANDQGKGFGVINRINDTLHGTSPGHENDMSRYVKRVILCFHIWYVCCRNQNYWNTGYKLSCIQYIGRPGRTACKNGVHNPMFADYCMDTVRYYVRLDLVLWWNRSFTSHCSHTTAILQNGCLWECSVLRH